MVLVATKPRAVRSGGRERLARLLLAFTGLTLALGPPVTVLAGTSSWSSVALMTVMPLGVLLVVLAAFYPRITGPVRFGLRPRRPHGLCSTTAWRLWREVAARSCRPWR